MSDAPLPADPRSMKARGLLRPPAVVAAVAFAKLALLLSCATAYGYGSRELYDLACANHLAWGYVGRPPLSIALLQGVSKLYGESLLSLRVVPALVGTVAVILTARLARKLGAGVPGQALAALSVVAAPRLLTLDHVYSSRGLEVLALTAVAGLVARAVMALPADAAETPHGPRATGGPGATRAWLGVGVAVGLTLLNDLSSAVFFGALALGFATTSASPRAPLRTRGPWLALGVACVVLSPYLAWERVHGWPTRQVLAQAFRGPHPGVVSFVRGELLGMLPTNAIVWLAGVVAFLRDKRLVAVRPLGIAFTLSFVAFGLLGDGRAPYLAPAYPVVFAAGAAVLEPWLGRRRGGYAALVGALVLSGAVAAPLALPLLSIAKYEQYARVLRVLPRVSEGGDGVVLPAHFADMFGWPELVRTVGNVSGSLSAPDRDAAVVLASNDARAGALALLGPTLGLPPVVSGHDSFWAWGTAGASGDLVIAVGGDEAFLRAHWNTVELVTVFGHSLAAPSERHIRIYLCRGAVAPLDLMWDDFKAFD